VVGKKEDRKEGKRELIAEKGTFEVGKGEKRRDEKKSCYLESNPEKRAAASANAMKERESTTKKEIYRPKEAWRCAG